MATNQTTVTITTDTTYTLPISYADLTMIEQVDHQEQLLLFRNDIEELYGSTLSLREYREMGQIASSWLTLDTVNREVTSITIPSNAKFTMDDDSEVSFPALQAGESITVRRVNVIAEPYVTWTTGSRITADQLNLVTNHLLGLIQEVSDTANRSIYREDSDVVLNPMTRELNGGLFKITEIADPTNLQDAATKNYVDLTITELSGAAEGLATLDADGKVPMSQLPTVGGVLPNGTFFSRSTAPTRTTAAQGLYKWGSLWWNTTNGRLYVYVSDDRYGSSTEETEGDVGYWVDVSSPI